jgi:hypothetical protein
MELDSDLSIYLVLRALKALETRYKMIRISIFPLLSLNELGIYYKVI